MRFAFGRTGFFAGRRAGRPPTTESVPVGHRVLALTDFFTFFAQILSEPTLSGVILDSGTDGPTGPGPSAWVGPNLDGAFGAVLVYAKWESELPYKPVQGLGQPGRPRPGFGWPCVRPWVRPKETI